jgi:NAD(P)-dependent dehydrogenase (short-subunit alcohol dehydrogenase family)
VAVVSRTQATCDEVAAEIEQMGRRALACACHVGRWDQLEPLVDRVYGEFGRVDVLVNNAGKSPLYDSLAGVSEALFDSVIGLNLKGPFRLSALVGERMMAGGGGSIVNISSIASVRPEADALPYAAAKAGLNALTAGLAQAFGPAVRVNAVLPGAFDTDVATHWAPDMRKRLADQAALGRVGNPAEICGAVLYLASDAASFTTGSCLRIDGGVA